MYATMVAAASESIDLLKNVSGAEPAIDCLQKALYKAEKRYIRDVKWENAYLKAFLATHPMKGKKIFSVFTVADELYDNAYLKECAEENQTDNGLDNAAEK